MKKRRSVSLAATLVLLPGLLVASAGPAAAAAPTFTKAFEPSTVGPGSTASLTFTIITDVTTTNIAFTDALPAGVTIADPANASMDECGSANGRDSNPELSAPDGGSLISFSGGAMGAGVTCIITVDVTSATVGTHTNTTSTLTSSEPDAAPATADLTVDTTLPGFSKSFSPSTVALGGESTLTFLVDNTSNASDVSNLDFTDDLPTGMMIADPPGASTDCGTAAIPPTLTADAGASAITLDANGTGGFPAVAAGATCTVIVDVTTSAAGPLDNVSGNLLADFVDAGFASDTLDVTVSTNLHLDKDFTTDPVPPGATTTLVLSVTNRNRDFPATDVAFTDDLTSALAGLTFASLTSNDCGGTVSGVGTTTIDLSGGTVAPGITCSVVAELSVPAGATPGSHTNTTTAVTGTIDGTGDTGNIATADLVVSPIPALVVEFTDDPVGSGDDVTLSHTLINTSTTSGLTDGEFIHEIVPPLPFPATVSLPPTPDPPCGAGSSLALVSTGTDRQGLQLTGASLNAAGNPGSSCAFTVAISIPDGFPAGTYGFTTGAPTATVDGATRTGKPASDDLVVVGAPRLTKEFTDDPTEPGQTVTLEFTLDNPGESASDLTAIGFTDDLDAALTGLAATGAMPTDPCGTGSSLTGTSTLTFSGGTLAGGASCTFQVTLQVPTGAAPGTYTNTTSEVTATGDGVTTTGPAAEDDLIVAAFRVSKEFLDDPTVPGGTVALEFTLDNTTGATDATSISFSDNLGAMLSGTDVDDASVPPNPCGGSLLEIFDGFLFFSGGIVSAGASCTFGVNVLVPAGATRDTYTNTTSDVSYDDGGGTRQAPPATDDLVVVDGILLDKEFTDDPVGPGDTATLEFTITSEGAGDATAIAFTDDLDAALTDLTASSVPFNDCGATVDIADPKVIDVSGGALADLATCTIRVAVAVPATAPSGTHTNTTSTVTATIGGVGVTGAAASDDLEVSSVLFSKAFDATTPAGTTAELTFTIQNRDTSTGLSRIGFTDDLDAALSGMVAVAPLPAAPCGARSTLTGTSTLTFTGGELGTSDTCTFTVTVQVPASAPAGTHTNTTSDLSAGGLTVAPPATADLEVTNEADLRVAASPLTSAVLVDGSTSTTFTVTNDGPSTATDTELVIGLTGSPTLDATPAGCTLAVTTLTCDLGDLAPTSGLDVVVDLTHPSVGTDGLTGTVSTSTTDTDNGNDSTSASITVEPPPTLSLTDSPDPVTAGSEITFTITIDNSASSLGATDLALTIDLDAALTGMVATNLPLADACGSGSTLTGTSTVTLADGLVAAGGSCSFDVGALVPSDATTGPVTTTTSRLTGDVDGTALDTDGDATSTTVEREADASVAISPANPTVVPGGTTSSTVTITNDGPSTASVSVDISLDAPSTITSVTGGTCTVALDGATAECTLIDVAPGTDVDLTVEASHPAAGNDVLTATATADSGIDPDAGNDTATSTIRVAFPPPPPPAPSADLSVSTDQASQAVEAGGNATTTVTATNAGPSTAADATLTVALSGNGAFGAAPTGCTLANGELTCGLGALDSGASASVEVVTAHADPGDTTLTATVSSPTADPDDANGQATATITASAPPSEDLADDCQARPSSRPSDANDGPHSGAIDCLVALDVISGFEDGSFRGTLDVSRAQFASMLVRAIDHLGLGLATNAPDAFDDDNGSPHETAANRLAAAGILEGTSDRTFSGGLPISRSQVAAVLARTVRTLTNVTVPPREDQFDDDDGRAFEAEHDTAAQLELVSGVAPRQYRGVLSISRAQTASILARFIVLVDGPVS